MNTNLDAFEAEWVPCTHPVEERFVSRAFTILGHPAGEELELCAGCGADFGPPRGRAVALSAARQGVVW